MEILCRCPMRGRIRLGHSLPRRFCGLSLRLPALLGPGWPTLQSWYLKMTTSLGWTERWSDWKEPGHLAEEQTKVVKELRRTDATWLLTTQDVLRDLSEGLQNDQHQAAAEDFESQVSLQKLLLEEKVSLLKTHRETLNKRLSEEEFAVLEEKWYEYFQAKKVHSEMEAQGKSGRMVGSDKIKSSSRWNMQDMSRYVRAFASLSWQSGQSTSALNIESLENHLQFPIDPFDVQLHKCLQNEQWKRRYLRTQALVLRVLQCPLSNAGDELQPSEPSELAAAELEEFFAASSKERPQQLLELLEAKATGGRVHLVVADLAKGQRQSLHIACNVLAKQGRMVQSKSVKEEDGHEVNLIHLWVEVPDGNAGSVEDVEEEVCMRLAGLADLQGPEASTRCVIDSLIFPLCQELELGITMEESCRAGNFPISICDYILRSDEVLAVIEAKRCSPNWIWTLSQGVAQCIWQLAILRESQPSKPCLGLVTDGRRWVCLQLQQQLAISSALDISRKEHFWILLNVLLQHLESKCK